MSWKKGDMHMKSIKKVLTGMLSLFLVLAAVISVMPDQVQAAEKKYLMLQVRLLTDEGIKEYGDGLDLSGLTFCLLGQRTDSGQWEPVETAYDEAVGEVVSVDYYYFSYFKADFGRITDPELYSAFKVVLKENSSYAMEDLAVELGDIGQQTTPSKDYYLDLTKKVVPADSTEATADIISAGWTGTGTEPDPYSAAVTVDRFTDEINIRTANENAVITYGQQDYTGRLTAVVNYGSNVYEFTVTSEDGSKVSCYRAEVTREKYDPLPPSASLKGVSPSAEGGADGMITGLDSARLYEYRGENDTDYTPVKQGSTEITGLTPGKYYVRFAETESQYASKDREVVVKEPVIHTITLPEENIPEGITVLECPETMTEGRTFTIRLQLPENTLIKNIGYSYKAGEWTATSAFSGVQHMQEDGHTVAVLQRDALSHDITITGITLLEGKYYTVTAGPEDTESASPFIQCEISVTGEGELVSGDTYYEEGSDITAVAAIRDDWRGYAELSSLTVYRKGTDEVIEPDSLTKTDKNEWSLSLAVQDDIEIRFGIYTYPCDTAELDEVIALIGDLDQYVDNAEKDTLITRLNEQGAFRKQPLKNQPMVDNYTALLRAAYESATVRTDLTDSKEVSVTLEGNPHTYDGKPWKPDVAVTYQGNVLKKGVDYLVYFPEDMTSVGDKDIRIEFIGLYRGEITVKGSIVEKQADSSVDQNAAAEGNKAVDTGIRDSYEGYVLAILSSIFLMGVAVTVRTKKKK